MTKDKEFKPNYALNPLYALKILLLHKRIRKPKTCMFKKIKSKFISNGRFYQTNLYKSL